MRSIRSIASSFATSTSRNSLLSVRCFSATSTLTTGTNANYTNNHSNNNNNSNNSNINATSTNNSVNNNKFNNTASFNNDLESTKSRQYSSMQQLSQYVNRPMQGVTLNQFAFATPTNQTLLASAQYLHKEVPTMLAKRIQDLQAMPFGVANTATVKHLIQLYWRALDEITRLPFPNTLEQDYVLTEVFRAFLRRNRGVVVQLTRAMRDSNLWVDLDDNQVTMLQEFVDNFITARLGLRLLVAQHVALHTPQSGFVGIVASNCSAQQISEDAVRDAQNVCERVLSRAPLVRIQGDIDATFRYIPSHLKYILYEILKNSMRAVVERHANVDTLPPIDIVIGAGDGDICFKVSDQGGGITQRDTTRLFSYLFTTGQETTEAAHEQTIMSSSAFASRAADEDEDESIDLVRNAPLGGVGYGLPVSRLYARYFGGDLRIFPLAGHGTDVYVHIRVLKQTNEFLHV